MEVENVWATRLDPILLKGNCCLSLLVVVLFQVVAVEICIDRECILSCSRVLSSIDSQLRDTLNLKSLLEARHPPC